MKFLVEFLKKKRKLAEFLHSLLVISSYLLAKKVVATHVFSYVKVTATFFIL